MSAGNSIRREDFASEEQIDRHLCRLRERGDRGQTGNLFAGIPPAEPVQERAAPAKPGQDSFEFHARGDDLPLFAA